jgi:putative transposase
MNITNIYNIDNMARELRKPRREAIYHLIAKGNQGDFIFDEKEHKVYFLQLLKNVVEDYQALVYGYCIMGNHYHIILQNVEPNLSEIMHYIGSSFASFLRGRGRIGHIFSGRYKSILLEGRERILYLSKYVHLNPVRASMVRRPEEYGWSSYKYFTWDLEPPEWLYTGWIKDHITRNHKMAREEYREFVEDGVHLPLEAHENRKTARAIVEGERFLQDIIDRGGIDMDAGDMRLDALYLEVCRFHGVDDLTLLNGKRCPRILRQPRAVFVYIAKEYTLATHAEIARRLGNNSPSGVAHIYREFLGEIDKDNEKGCSLRESVAEIVSRSWFPHPGL